MAKKSKGIVQTNDIWKKEEIPDDALLYCYVFKANLDSNTGKPKPRAFQNTPFNTGTDLSSDWNKYSTPEDTRQRLSGQQKPNGGYKNPNDYYVVSLLVEDIRTDIPSQTIEHDPIRNVPNLPDNRAHTKIIGEKDPEVRLKLVDLCEWAIEPDI